MRLCLEKDYATDASDSMLGKLQYLHRQMSWCFCDGKDENMLHSQLIQPKLQKRQLNPPDTTNQASQPPSGNDLGSFTPNFAGPFSTSAFSRSRPRRSLDVTGMISNSFLDGVGPGSGLGFVSTDPPSATVIEDVDERFMVGKNGPMGPGRSFQ